VEIGNDESKNESRIERKESRMKLKNGRMEGIWKKGVADPRRRNEKNECEEPQCNLSFEGETESKI
jgi:hypothetical protein